MKVLSAILILLSVGLASTAMACNPARAAYDIHESLCSGGDPTTGVEISETQNILDRYNCPGSASHIVTGMVIRCENKKSEISAIQSYINNQNGN